MKYIISERQYNLIIEDREILEIPSLVIFDNDWDLLQQFLERRGNPPYSILGDLDSSDYDIESLGNLVSVKGNLLLSDSPIDSLGALQYVEKDCDLENTNISSFGNLKFVGGGLWIRGTKIKSLGNLKFVGSNFYIRNSELAYTMTEDEIRSSVEVGGKIKIYDPNW